MSKKALVMEENVLVSVNSHEERVERVGERRKRWMRSDHRDKGEGRMKITENLATRMGRHFLSDSTDVLRETLMEEGFGSEVVMVGGIVLVVFAPIISLPAILIALRVDEIIKLNWLVTFIPLYLWTIPQAFFNIAGGIGYLGFYCFLGAKLDRLGIFEEMEFIQIFSILILSTVLDLCIAVGYQYSSVGEYFSPFLIVKAVRFVLLEIFFFLIAYKLDGVISISWIGVFSPAIVLSFTLLRTASAMVEEFQEELYEPTTILILRLLLAIIFCALCVLSASAADGVTMSAFEIAGPIFAISALVGFIGIAMIVTAGCIHKLNNGDGIVGH